MSSGHWEIELKWMFIFPNFVNNWLSDLEYVARGNISYNDLNIEIQYRGKELMKNNGYWTMIFKLFLLILTRCVRPQLMLLLSTIRGEQKPTNRPSVCFQLMVNSVFILNLKIISSCIDSGVKGIDIFHAKIQF